MTIIEKIKENAALYPERYMMVESLPTGEKTLTWQQLDDYSEALASWLDANLKTNIPVVVYGHKDPFMVVCFVACSKTGRAYCPIDVNVPLSRVEAIIEEVRPEVVLSTEELPLSMDNILSYEQISDIVSNYPKTISPEKFIRADSVYYIIFTSGSTGIPKGVQITRDCLDNFIKWALTLGNGIAAGTHYTFLNQAPFSFDLSVMDLYLCLYSGGTLWALSKAVQNDMKLLYKSLGSSGVNIWVSTPSFADVCLSDPVFTGQLLPDLSVFLFCGETLTNKTVSRLQKKFPDRSIVNTYGPTESTCAVTEIEITGEINDRYTPLPVGTSKPGTWIRICDSEGNQIPDGEHGEIVIVGDSVSVGYWNNLEKNKKSFGLTVQDGKEYRYYKTGDEGYLSDGLLFYGGRIDLQVKLHGYRIELEDIESNLMKLEGVEQAVVIPKYRNEKVSSLVACIITTKQFEDEASEVSAIKEQLRTTLPEYMIPKKIRFMSDMPRTNNGKIDRKAMGELI